VQLVNSNSHQHPIIQLVQQLAQLFGDLYSKLWRWFRVRQLFRFASFARSPGTMEQRIASDLAAPSFRGEFPSLLTGGFALSQHDEYLPQVIAIVETRETPLLDAAAEAIECRYYDVLLVSRSSRRLAQLAASNLQQPFHEMLPELLRRPLIPILQRVDPVRH